MVGTVTFTYYAPEGETFTQEHFDTQIGRTSQFKVGADSWPVEVIGATVAEDGLSVEITLATDAQLEASHEGLIGHALAHPVGQS